MVRPAEQNRAGYSSTPAGGILAASRVDPLPALPHKGRDSLLASASGAGFVWEVGEIEAVDEVPENRQAVFVDPVLGRRLLLLFLRDDPRALQDVGGDEDRAFEADGQRDRVARPGVHVDLSPVLTDVEAGKEDFLAERGHHDPAHRDPELPEGARHPVVCDRAFWWHALDPQRYGGRV